MTATDDWLQEFRRLMPVNEQWVYLDHAAVAPLSRPARDAMIAWAKNVAENGYANRARCRANVERLRRLGAKLISADPDEIALVRNTTEGINIVAEGFPWQPGDNVVTLECEFPSNLYPWQNLASRGVETRLVPAAASSQPERVDLNQLADACDERTRIVSASWVGYLTGWRNDVRALAEVAHRKGALFFLDAIQGLGVFPLDAGAAGVDFLAADGHKWLLGPEGAGLLYVRQEHLDRLRPVGVGWNSVRQAGDFDNVAFDLKPTAARYEGGSYNLCGIAGLHASLACLLDLGIDRMAESLLEVTDRLCTQLEECGASIVSSREPQRRSGIVAFDCPAEEPQAVQQRCLKAGVVVNVRGGRVRVSPHAYTSDEEIDRLIAVLAGDA